MVGIDEGKIRVLSGLGWACMEIFSVRTSSPFCSFTIIWVAATQKQDLSWDIDAKEKILVWQCDIQYRDFSSAQFKPSKCGQQKSQHAIKYGKLLEKTNNCVPKVQFKSIRFMLWMFLIINVVVVYSMLVRSFYCFCNFLKLWRIMFANKNFFNRFFLCKNAETRCCKYDTNQDFIYCKSNYTLI